MKSSRLSNGLFVAIVGMVFTACGGDVQDRSATGPVVQDGHEALTKQAAPQGKARAGVYLIVWDLATGRPFADAEVAISRSVAGRARNNAWTVTTDADGLAKLDIVAPPETPNGNRGASGYYTATATDASGDELGEWTSIPINGGKENIVSLPTGGSATVRAGAGPLAWLGEGGFGWSGDLNGLPGSADAYTWGFIMGNTTGDVWGLYSLDLIYSDVDLFTGASTPGSTFALPIEGATDCVQGVQGNWWAAHRSTFTKAPTLPFIVGGTGLNTIDESVSPAAFNTASSAAAAGTDCSDDLGAYLDGLDSSQLEGDFTLDPGTWTITQF